MVRKVIQRTGNIRPRQKRPTIKQLQIQLTKLQKEMSVDLDKSRTLYLEGDIDSEREEIMDLKKKLTVWAKTSRKPIVIYINSLGGWCPDGFAIFDTIMEARAKGIKVTTIAKGIAASMGCIILQAGTVRKMTPSSVLMIHEGSGGAIGKISQIEDELKYIKLTDVRANEIYSKRTGKTVRAIKKKIHRKDVHFNATQAMAYNLVDEVIADE